MCGNDTDAYSGLVYIIDANTLTMASAFDHFTATADAWGKEQFAEKAAASLSAVDGIALNQVIEYGVGGTRYNFYALILDNDKIYFSNLLENKAASTTLTANPISFESQNNGTTTFSHLAAFEGYKGAGYWQKAAATPVPEPTSGMLLILGLSALALRRRRQA